jgi:uncharacterized protein YjiS (DUF1127 family)
MNTLRNQTAFAFPANLAPLTPAEVEAYARRIRAEAIADLVFNAWTALKSVGTRAKAYLAQQRALAELNGLDDAMLRDIGLNRSQIPAAVAGLIARPVATAVNENAVTAPVTRLVPRDVAA